MARKWLEGAAWQRQETVTKPFAKTPGKRADELIRGSLIRVSCEKRKAGGLRSDAPAIAGLRHKTI